MDSQVLYDLLNRDMQREEDEEAKNILATVEKHLKHIDRHQFKALCFLKLTGLFDDFIDFYIELSKRRGGPKDLIDALQAYTIQHKSGGILGG